MKAWAMLLVLAIAGCADPTQEIISDPEPTIQEDPLNATINPTQWQVGDWFGHHIFFGDEDTEGFHINVIIDDEDSNNWHFVTDDPEVARFEAVLDIPITGDIAKADLDTTGFGGPWELYDFPLFDGKEWEGTVQYDFFDSYDVIYKATYAEDVTPFGDNRPGYKITGSLANGTVVVETDYDPSFGWYNDFVVYDTMGPGDDFLLRAIHMGWGHNWTGTAYEYASEVMIDENGQIIVPAADVTTAATLMMVDASEDATHMMALQHCFAFAGTNEATLRAPSGTSYDCQVQALPDGPDVNSWPAEGYGNLYEIPHEVGTWNYARASVGFVAGGGLTLWELTEQEILF